MIFSGISIASMVWLAMITMASFFMKGELQSSIASTGYVSCIAAMLSLYFSVRLWFDKDAYGPMLHAALYLGIAACAAHAVVFLMGFFSLLIQ